MKKLYTYSRISNKKNESGFIAIMSVLIISAILVILIFATGTSSFYARFDALNSEYKRISVGLSEACANIAILKIAKNYSYNFATDPEYVIGKGVLVKVGSDDADSCHIVAVSYSNHVYDALGNEIRKTITATTSAQYPPTNGSWSTHKIVATITNPTYTSVPPPTCGLGASPASIHSGQSVTLSWSTAGTATSFKLDRDMGGTVTTIYSNAGTSGSWPDSPTVSATYTATITGPGGSTQCFVPVTVQPSLATCADTVLMLSRDMNNGPDYTNEGSAATAFLNLYASVTPHPQASVGSYTGLDNSAAQIPLTGYLSSDYTGLTTTINTFITAGRTNGDDISSAISIASNELNTDTDHGGRHVATRQKVLVIVSPSGGHNSEAVNAIPADDTAKLNGIQIFAIDFGNGSSQDTWAELASGTHVYPGHQQGALNDGATAQAENDDEDGFFIATSSAAMTPVFKTIAQIVCPATIPPPPPTPPPPPPPPPSPSEPISIGSWDEIINIVP